MNLRNLEKAPDYKVERWLKEEFNLDNYQTSKMYDNESVRFSPFEFYQERPYNSNIWLRLSIVFFPFVFLLLWLGLPLTYLIRGRWGYNRNFDWILKWMDKLK